MIDVKELLRELREEPYEKIVIRAPHSGKVEFVASEPGVRVVGPGGTWKEVPGTLLARLEREQVKRPINAPQKGEVMFLGDVRNGQFVQAGQELMTIRHFLTKEEVIARILRRSLSLFLAPEKGKYYFFPEVDIKIKTKGSQTVHVEDGMELFILSRMKRETSVRYTGPGGIIYAVYFETNDSVDRDAPLIGVCPESQLGQIQEVVSRIQSEWEERD
ncbi:biotin attachment protein [Desulfomicrobium salsuginis]